MHIWTLVGVCFGGAACGAVWNVLHGTTLSGYLSVTALTVVACTELTASSAGVVTGGRVRTP